MSSIRELFLRGRGLLGRLPRTDPSLESRLLLQKAAGLTEKEFFTRPETRLPLRTERRFLRLIEKRRARVPLAYLTGEKEFWSIPFKVFRGVLIPRPETELVVEKVLELSLKKRELIVDVGTGSGAIAVALAGELPKARIIATDISRRALKAARLNAERRAAATITFIEGNLFGGRKGPLLRESADFVVSNPPYVSEGEWRTLAPEIRMFEPKRALVAGGAGLEFIRRLIEGSLAALKPGGHLVFEIGRGQADGVRPLFDRRWTDVRFVKDLRGIPRVAAARKA